METIKPESPTIISGFRPYRSEALAQNGEEKAHKIADSEKIATTISSGIANERPINGNTEISPVFPMAVATDEQNIIANARFGRVLEVVSEGIDAD